MPLSEMPFKGAKLCQNDCGLLKFSEGLPISIEIGQMV
jgi:hypothetical protein